MISRERLQAVLDHETPDRLCVDFGAGGQTGIGAGAVYRLREAVLGKDQDYRVRISEPYQMLGEIDEELRQALALDVVGTGGPGTMFGFRTDGGWKPFDMFDGTPVLVPEDFNVIPDTDGGLLIYPEGDTSAPPSAKMPKGGYYFDALDRQRPFVEAELDWRDNCEEFGVLTAEDLSFFAEQTRKAAEDGHDGVYMTFPGAAFGDIALVPAVQLKDPKGIRGIEEWYLSFMMRPDFVKQVFEYQCDIALKNVDLLAETVGSNVQVAFVSGTDFGAQHGPFIARESYREFFLPYHKKINEAIHAKTTWKTFIHSCGSMHELLPDVIEAGFDIYNPVQCSAHDMDPAVLKREFGEDIVFWGGGVDTQTTLPFGTPDEVYGEVRERVDTFFDDGTGFVFNSVHNVQGNVPTENLVAMFRALNDARGIQGQL